MIGYVDGSGFQELFIFLKDIVNRKVFLFVRHFYDGIHSPNTRDFRNVKNSIIRIIDVH